MYPHGPTIQAPVSATGMQKPTDPGAPQRVTYAIPTLHHHFSVPHLQSNLPYREKFERTNVATQCCRPVDNTHLWPSTTAQLHSYMLPTVLLPWHAVPAAPVPVPAHPHPTSSGTPARDTPLFSSAHASTYTPARVLYRLSNHCSERHIQRESSRILPAPGTASWHAVLGMHPCVLHQ